jgi:hypothetical protein
MGIRTRAWTIFDQIKAAAKRALADEKTGGPEYDADGETIYPEGATIIHDAEPRNANPRKSDR